MAPNLRSSGSNQSSPTGKSDISSNATPPRKVPHCTKCKRPRAGHPRTGCPYADSPSKENDSEGSGALNSRNLTAALSTLKIASPSEREHEGDDKAVIRNRRRSAQIKARENLVRSDSLLSLSTNSSDIIARLTRPGAFDNDHTDNDETDTDGARTGTAKVVRWQETLLATPVPRKPRHRVFPRSPMPGTLIPPTPESSFDSTTNHLPKQDDFLTPQPLSPGSSSSTPQPHASQRLARSMSSEQRDMFISKVTQASTATIYVLHKDDIELLANAATSLNLHSRIVMNEHDDNDTQGLLVLGRNEMGVEKLMDKIRKEDMKRAALDKEMERAQIQAEAYQNMVQIQNQRLGKVTQTSAFRAAAGGAVVGAVGAWAGLAFS